MQLNFLISLEEEAALAAAATEGQVVRAWDLWCQRIGSME